MTTLEEWCAARSVAVNVKRDRGTQVGRGGWEHHEYVLVVQRPDGAGGTLTLDDIPWQQGLGVETSPTDVPAEVVDSLVSDALSWRDAGGSFVEWCTDFGASFVDDMRDLERTWTVLSGLAPRVAEWLGGWDQLDTVAQLERP